MPLLLPTPATGSPPSSSSALLWEDDNTNIPATLSELSEALLHGTKSSDTKKYVKRPCTTSSLRTTTHTTTAAAAAITAATAAASAMYGSSQLHGGASGATRLGDGSQQFFGSQQTPVVFPSLLLTPSTPELFAAQQALLGGALAKLTPSTPELFAAQQALLGGALAKLADFADPETPGATLEDLLGMISSPGLTTTSTSTSTSTASKPITLADCSAASVGKQNAEAPVKGAAEQRIIAAKREANAHHEQQRQRRRLDSSSSGDGDGGGGGGGSDSDGGPVLLLPGAIAATVPDVDHSRGTSTKTGISVLPTLHGSPLDLNFSFGGSDAAASAPLATTTTASRTVQSSKPHANVAKKRAAGRRRRGVAVHSGNGKSAANTTNIITINDVGDGDASSGEGAAGGKVVRKKGDYRGNRNHPLDAHLFTLFTAEDLRMKGKPWSDLIGSLNLNADQTIRVKQLHRRELCKGYSRDTRNRTDEKQRDRVKTAPQLEQENRMLRAEVDCLKARLANLETRLSADYGVAT